MNPCHQFQDQHTHNLDKDFKGQIIGDLSMLKASPPVYPDIEILVFLLNCSPVLWVLCISSYYSLYCSIVCIMADCLILRNFLIYGVMILFSDSDSSICLFLPCQNINLCMQMSWKIFVIVLFFPSSLLVFHSFAKLCFWKWITR